MILLEKICKRLYTSLQTKIEGTKGWNYFVELLENGTNTAIDSTMNQMHEYKFCG